MKRGGPSYMVETLASLRVCLPHQPLCLMMGSDTFSQLDHWRKPQQILQLAHLIVVHRADHTRPPPASLSLNYTDTLSELQQCSSGLVYQHMITLPAISSTTIRYALAQGDPTVARHLPPAVHTLIRQQQLYQQTT